jgi:hypothetical protein
MSYTRFSAAPQGFEMPQKQTLADEICQYSLKPATLRINSPNWRAGKGSALFVTQAKFLLARLSYMADYCRFTVHVRNVSLILTMLALEP